MARWSAAVMAIAGLEGCAGTGIGPGPSAPDVSKAPDTRSSSSNANYFDYSNYANYINGPTSNYGDYANYANYSDYANYGDGYGDSYLDYANYGNYSDYSDYSNYSDYSDYQDYTDYWDYSDYSDYGDYSDYSDAVSDAEVQRRVPLGGYGDYADVYADLGVPGPGEGPGTPGRAPGARPPFHGAGRRLTYRPDQHVHGSAWVEAPRDRLHPELGGEPAARHEARQGAPGKLMRPERQKPGRFSRGLAGPSNKPGPSTKE